MKDDIKVYKEYLMQNISDELLEYCKKDFIKELKKEKIDINKFNVKQIIQTIEKPGTIDDLGMIKNYYTVYFKLEEKNDKI